MSDTPPPTADGAAPQEQEPRSEPPVDRARRRFLLAGGAYAAPAVLAAFALGEEAYGACPPYTTNCDPFRSCAPGRCSPLLNPCSPVTGG